MPAAEVVLVEIMKQPPVLRRCAAAAALLFVYLLSVADGQSCPERKEGTLGVCVEECSSDDDCGVGEKCCSNGCGHRCVTLSAPDDPGNEVNNRGNSGRGNFLIGGNGRNFGILPGSLDSTEYDRTLQSFLGQVGGLARGNGDLQTNGRNGFLSSFNGFQSTNNGFQSTNNGFRSTNNGFPQSRNIQFPSASIGNQGSDSSLQNANRDYLPTYDTHNPGSTGFQPISQGFQVSNPGLSARHSNNGVQRTPNNFQGSNSGFQPSNSGFLTSYNRFQARNNGYQLRGMSQNQGRSLTYNPAGGFGSQGALPFRSYYFARPNRFSNFYY